MHRNPVLSLKKEKKLNSLLVFVFWPANSILYRPNQRCRWHFYCSFLEIFHVYVCVYLSYTFPEHFHQAKESISKVSSLRLPQRKHWPVLLEKPPLPSFHLGWVFFRLTSVVILKSSLSSLYWNSTRSYFSLFFSDQYTSFWITLLRKDIWETCLLRLPSEELERWLSG